MIEAIVLGFLQGMLEWLPVSSEGVVAAVYAFFFDKPLDEAIGFALWLHAGTVPAAVVVLRRDISILIRDFVSYPRKPSPLLRFFFLATLVSAIVGAPLLLTLGSISTITGAAVMGVIGTFMLITGYLQIRSKPIGYRNIDQIKTSDIIATGVAQGLAVIPGLSRSGMTVVVLLTRRLSIKDALVLSFLLSIPASIGSALFVGIKHNLIINLEAIIAALVAFIVGIITIRGLLALSSTIKFGWFVIAVGAAMIIGALWGELL